MQLEVGDEARGTGSVEGKFLLPPAHTEFVLYVSVRNSQVVYLSKRTVDGRISDLFPFQINCPDNLMVDI